MCLVSYKPALNKRSGAFGFDMFTAVVDADPQLRGVTLQGLGEPLLKPEPVASRPRAGPAGRVGSADRSKMTAPAALIPHQVSATRLILASAAP
jgi:hypothetical protein